MKSNKGFWITAGAAILAAVILAAVLLAGRREASAQGNEQGGTLADALNGGSARDKYMTEEAAIIRRMKDEMLIREASGSAPIDFLKGMIPHREAEVSMAESYLKYGGESRELEDLARDIVTARKEELDQMNDLLKQYQESKETDEEKEALYLEDCSRIFGTEEDSSRRAGRIRIRLTRPLPGGCFVAIRWRRIWPAASWSIRRRARMGSCAGWRRPSLSPRRRKSGAWRAFCQIKIRSRRPMRSRMAGRLEQLR